MGYAVADQIRGPYRKAAQPLLKTNAGASIVGPGGQDIVLDKAGDTWLLFHSWSGNSYRAMNVARLDWQDGAPVVCELN